MTPFIQVTWDGTDAPMRHTVSWLGTAEDEVPPLLELDPELQPAMASAAAAHALAVAAVILCRTLVSPLSCWRKPAGLRGLVLVCTGETNRKLSYKLEAAPGRCRIETLVGGQYVGGMRAMASQSGLHQASGRGPARPGTPSLLRELNDRAALELLLDGRSLTRSQLSDLTGVSKVTVAQMLTRLEERGLVAAVGSNSGGRGPNAVLYSVVPSSAYVAALYMEQDLVRTAVADVTGRVIAEVREDTANGEGDPVELVRSAIDRACRRAGVSVSRLSAFVIGSPGVVDPVTGDPRLAINLPAWHEGVLAGLHGALHRNVLIENDVNLAAMAEHAIGAAAGTADFVLLWLDVGVGLATVLDGRLHRGVSG